jgi:glycosyltransferase involved in cell wall biosynthesis
MNILMLNHNVKWRGTFFRAFHFARSLVRRGHQVTIFTISPASRLRCVSQEVGGVAIVETPDLLVGQGRTGWDPYDTARRIWALARGPRFDIVHGFDCRPVVIAPALFLRRAFGIPFVSDWADWWGRGGIVQGRPRPVRYLFGPVETFFEEHFRPFADCVTVTSRALHDRAVALGIERSRVHYIPSGADTDTIRPLPKAETRIALGFPPDATIIEFVGFINYDFDLIIRSFPLVQRRFPDVVLLLVGQRYPVTRHILKDQNLRRNIREVGIVPFQELPKYLACADVLLLPFTDKICNIGRGPIKLGDYMAAGRPIVSQAVGDLRHIFRQEAPFGVLTQDTPESFAQGICSLLENPERAEHYGRNARSAAERVYSWDVSAQSLERLYEHLLQTGAPRPAIGRAEVSDPAGGTQLLHRTGAKQ